MPLNRSAGDPEERFTKKYVAVKEINESMNGESIRVRGRVHNLKAQGNKQRQELNSDSDWQSIWLAEKAMNIILFQN